VKSETIDRGMKAAAAGRGKGSRAHNKIRTYIAGTCKRLDVAMALRALVLGVVSLVLYVAVFTHQGLITDICTRGHWYAAFPIIIVLVFSLIHGPFANYSLSLLGVKAKKKK